MMTRPARRTSRTFPALAAVVVVVISLGLGLSGCGGSARLRRPAGHPAGHPRTPAARTTTSSPTHPSPAAPTATAPTARPAPAGDRVAYGLGDAPGQFARCTATDPHCCDLATGRCDLAQTRGYYDDPLFLKLITPASAHRVGVVRLFVPYDAVSQWNGSTTDPGCEYSEVLEHPWDDVANGLQDAGESIDDLIAGVIEARADGLQPMVTIAGYPFAAARPPWDQAIPDPSTIGGSWEYRCGLQGILGELSRLPAWEQPHVWEALNEPEAFGIFNGPDAAPATECDAGATPQPDGPAKAACFVPMADAAIHAFAGHAGDTVIAGTFEHPYVGYLGAYAAELAHLMPGAAFPATWSVHDYHEVTGAFAGSGAGELARFDDALAADTGGRAHSLWITEAGTVLTSGVRSGDCPAVGVDPAGTLGACINGQPARQTAAARAFFALPAVASAVPITHLFWYQFTGAPLWDSGLVDPQGQPRPVYCIFYGQGSCSGSANAA